LTPLATIPGNAAVEADQGDRLAVPDQAEILQAVVAVGPGDRPERRVQIEHARLASLRSEAGIRFRPSACRTRTTRHRIQQTREPSCYWVK